MTLDDQIISVRRMARYSRYLARVARASAAEFSAEWEAAREAARKVVREAALARAPVRLGRDREHLVYLRSMCPDREAEARRHDRETNELEAVARRLEEMRAALESFRIALPDSDGDVWLHMEHPGSGTMAAFNLDKPINTAQPESSGARTKIAHNTAAMVEAARQSALGDRP